MTDREIVEYLIQRKGYCSREGFTCTIGGCPIKSCGGTFEGAFLKARKWLADHPETVQRFDCSDPSRAILGNTNFLEVPAPASATPRRLTVGDRVVVTSTDQNYGVSVGEHGKIIKDDQTSRPYLVESDTHEYGWHTANQLIPESPDKMSGDAPRNITFQFQTADMYITRPISTAISCPLTEERQRARARLLSRI